jgi:hypothetical protein
MGGRWNAEQNRSDAASCACRRRAGAGAGRLRRDHLDAVTVAAAASKPFIAVAVAVVALVLGWQPEFRAGVQHRPAVQRGFRRWRTVVQPGLEQRPDLEPGRRAGVAVPIADEAGRLQRFGWQPSECEHAGGRRRQPVWQQWFRWPAWRRRRGRADQEHAPHRTIWKHWRSEPAWEHWQRWPGPGDRFDHIGAGPFLGAWIAGAGSRPGYPGIDGRSLVRDRGLWPVSWQPVPGRRARRRTNDQRGSPGSDRPQV